MRDTNSVSSSAQGFGIGSAITRLAPLLVLLLLTLFPFGWLGELWPAFGRALDQMFPTDGWHAVGHTTLFCLLGLVALTILPQLRARPLRYLGVLLLVGIGQ